MDPTTTVPTSPAAPAAPEPASSPAAPASPATPGRHQLEKLVASLADNSFKPQTDFLINLIQCPIPDKPDVAVRALTELLQLLPTTLADKQDWISALHDAICEIYSDFHMPTDPAPTISLLPPAMQQQFKEMPRVASKLASAYHRALQKQKNSDESDFKSMAAFPNGFRISFPAAFKFLPDQDRKQLEEEFLQHHNQLYQSYVKVAGNTVDLLRTNVTMGWVPVVFHLCRARFNECLVALRDWNDYVDLCSPNLLAHILCLYYEMFKTVCRNARYKAQMRAETATAKRDAAAAKKAIDTQELESALDNLTNENAAITLVQIANRRIKAKQNAQNRQRNKPRSKSSSKSGSASKRDSGSDRSRSKSPKKLNAGTRGRKGAPAKSSKPSKSILKSPSPGRSPNKRVDFQKAGRSSRPPSQKSKPRTHNG